MKFALKSLKQKCIDLVLVPVDTSTEAQKVEVYWETLGWRLKAAASGHLQAQCDLARLYSLETPFQNAEEAAYWLLKAAQ